MHNSKTTQPNFTSFFYCCLWPRLGPPLMVMHTFITLCTSGFMDDVMLSSPVGRIKHDVMFRRVQQVVVPVGCQITMVFG